MQNSTIMNKKGDMNWVIITMVLGLIALVIIIGLVMKGSNTAGDATSCEALSGNCVKLAACEGQRTFTTNCKLADGNTCCITTFQ